MPIIIVEEEKDAISHTVFLNDFVFHYVDNPKNTQTLKNLAIEEAQHVLIISKV